MKIGISECAVCGGWVVDTVESGHCIGRNFNGIDFQKFQKSCNPFENQKFNTTALYTLA